IAREFGSPSKSKGFTDEWMKPNVSRIAQIVASIPDKARMNSPTSLSSQQIIVQLLSLEEEREAIDTSDEIDKNGALLFIGETFSRICRRGSAGN
ncbi:telomere length regulation protein TEL2-like, partial [Trifolium medium]|nr:telomere length regulation protein TEL2-like [Trifolium medium]